ncbi:transporter substrate-binding domain-containing protein [Clostridium tyrobutyricum]|uniref:transporter substrate-binding domain-containing protein n=1 Tax=Clostridium tyrobutyricum TaxID=1519 RepID=UPI001C389460|nr:transporter substrate-binding domain-containing protein [Clostridium tyrobutyricum]MBV4427505.1 transporter substrate-binding domain-containing protein [Clostridium tyrobutyricum]MBV4442758.1 transporter substrate-binding domain-containing protein [Clostridium tyrobutyricum]
MSKIKKLITVLMLAVMVAAGFSGCGKSEGSTGDAEVSKTSSSGALTIEKLKKAGKLVSATEAANQPFEYLENNKIVGYDVDILNYICKDMGVKLQLIDLPFQGILAGLEAKKYDMVSAALGVTKERSNKYLLTYPIQEGTTVLIKKKGNEKIKSVEDMKGKVVATQTASYSETDVNNYNNSLKKSSGSGYTNLKLYATYPEAYMELKNSRVDLVAQSVAIANVLIKDHPNDYEIVGEIGSKSYTSWAFRKEDKEVYDFFNKEIHKMKKDGTLKKLQIKWFGTETKNLPEKDYIPNN